MRIPPVIFVCAAALALQACGGAEQPDANTTAVDLNVATGEVEPVNQMDAADVTPAEANALDNAIDANLPEEPLNVSEESLTGQ